MKCCLVTAAVATDFEDPDDAATRQVREVAAEPQLGILTLAAVLDQRGMAPRIFNLDRAYYEYLVDQRSRSVAGFARWAASRIASSGADVFGFGTICSSYPVTLRIAGHLKREAPGCDIVLGGPQASIVATETLAAFPFVDFILRGEADQTLPLLLDELSGKRRLSAVPGLSWRSPSGIQRNADAPLIEGLDSLPLPAYGLTGELDGAGGASLELGRGCPFGCTFCSTNDFFRRRFRLKSPERMLADMRAIASRFGIRSFRLIHDMFTVDRRRVAAFCDRLIQSGEEFAWSTSARTDCVDEELLGLMARAGCQGLFFGVETGSPRLQKVIEKGLDLDRARAAIDTTARLGMSNTVSLIAGFPEETWDDLRETMDIYMHTARHPGSHPQLNVLAPVAGTPIHARYQHQMVLEELCSDMSHQGRIHNQADRDLIRRYPEIFPNFYLLPTPGIDRAACLELREFLLAATARLRWLLVALHRSSTGILDVFLLWRRHRLALHPGLSGGSLRHYYIQPVFRRDFVGFVRRKVARFDSPAVRALLDYQEAFLKAETSDARLPRKGCTPARRLRASDKPVRARHVHVLQLDWDIQAVIDSLKAGQPAAVRQPVFYRTGLTPDDDIRLIRISPLLARALETCNGRRTVQACVTDLADCFAGSTTLRRYAAGYLLKNLLAENLIECRR